MTRDEVVKTLLTRAKTDPGFTTLVWQKLEEENADFFRAYYIRLKLKKQILLFNHLLEQQYHLMKYPVPPKLPVAPIQNGIHPMPVPNMPIGYPVMQQPPMSATGQPHLDPMACGISSCHVVNGVPAPRNFHPLRMNSGNESMMVDTSSGDVAPAMPQNGVAPSISDMPMSPTSIGSSGHFPFSASDISGMAVDTSVLDATFTSDVGSTVGLQLPDGNSRSLDQLTWNFSLSDLTADLSNLGGKPDSSPQCLHLDSFILWKRFALNYHFLLNYCPNYINCRKKYKKFTLKIRLMGLRLHCFVIK
uniref:Uncharacterized protein n=1 Tax=Kalanchoe fedtschenkoi TaxID=63787 RepID=A0A7N0UFF0_KALFE